MMGVNALHAKNVDSFIRATSNINMKDGWDRTYLHKAAKAGNSQAVRKLIQAGAHVNMRNRWEVTPLIDAVQSKNLDTVKELIKGGANVNARSQLTGPLHLASAKGNTNIVKELLKAGATVNSRDKWGRTPLYIAIEKGNSANTVKALINAGANKTAKASNGSTGYNRSKRFMNPNMRRLIVGNQAAKTIQNAWRKGKLSKTTLTNMPLNVQRLLMKTLPLKNKASLTTALRPPARGNLEKANLKEKMAANAKWGKLYRSVVKPSLSFKRVKGSLYY